MAITALLDDATGAGRRLTARLARWPWWGQVLAIYAVARAWSALVFVMASRQQDKTGWAPANPGYFEYTGLFWDAEWYHRIAVGGYPDTLPVGADGLVQQNEWAFFPLFPYACKAVMAITGLSWQVVAPTVAIAAGAAAMLVIYSVVRMSHRPSAQSPALASAASPDGTDRGEVAASAHRAGLATVLLVSFFPSSPALQVGYTESFALLGIAGFLWLLVRRHYLWAMPVALALGLTRAVALPLAVVVLVHAVVRWRSRDRDPVPPLQWAAMGVLTVVTVVSGFLWQIIAAAATGVPDAYFQTQSAWRGQAVMPVLPWLTTGEHLFGTIGGLIAVLGVLAAIVLAVVCRPAWRIGTELQVFAGAYPLYLVGVIQPWTSLARFLLLAFPLATITAGVSKSRAYLAVTTISFALFQIVWIVWLWQLNTPSGWPP